MTEQENNAHEQNVEIMEIIGDPVTVERKARINGNTILGSNLALKRGGISTESHAAVLEGRIGLQAAKDLGQENGPDGPIAKQSEKKAKRAKEPRPCIACSEPTKGGRFHPGCDAKMHRIADEHLRGVRALTDEQREYLESSGKMEQARKRAEKKAKGKGE